MERERVYGREMNIYEDEILENLRNYLKNLKNEIKRRAESGNIRVGENGEILDENVNTLNQIYQMVGEAVNEVTLSLTENLMENIERKEITLEEGEIMDLESERKTKDIKEFLEKAQGGTQFCYRRKRGGYLLGSIETELNI